MKSTIISAGLCIIVFLIAVFTSGCMPSRGWQVNFGISPVSAIDNNQQFAAPDTKSVRTAKY